MRGQADGRQWHGWRRPEALVLAFVLVFCGLAWSSARHINPLWDETNDHAVAVSLMERPLVGSGLDGSQARLPMYVTAAVYAIAHPSIHAARAVSIAMGAAAIVLTFIVGRRWFGTPAALLASGLLSIAPLFLTFARTGLTEGDAFCPATVLLVLLAFDRYLERRDSVRLALVAGALGLALTAKFYAVFLVPALLLCDVIHSHRRPASPRADSIRIADAERLDGRGVLVWAGGAFLLQSLAAAAAQFGLRSFAAVAWVVGVAIIAAGPLDQYLLAGPRRRTARRLKRWNTVAGWLVILPLAGAVCAAVCPAHVLNPEIARTLVRSLVHPVQPEPMIRIVDPARLYLGVLLLKLGPPLGVIGIAAIVWACVQRTLAGAWMAGACIVLYVLATLMLPLRQPFYLMSVYPLIVLLIAAFVLKVARLLRPRERLASAWIALVATSCLYLLWGTIRSYPEFGYYGYTLIGDRWLGADSRGYRNLVQVTNDGTCDALDWLAANVPPGRRVVSFLWDDHVIDAYLANRPPKYQLVRRNAYAARDRVPEIDDADFVVFALNNQASYRDAPSPRELAVRFGGIPRHVVFRGRGSLCMRVIQIFARPPAVESSSEGEAVSRD